MLKKLCLFKLLIMLAFKGYSEPYSECGDEKIVCKVSLVNLISTPDKYHNKTILVVGYYLSDFNHGSGVGWISLHEKLLDRMSSISFVNDDLKFKEFSLVPGEAYIFRGTFQKCSSINCSHKIIAKDGRLISVYDY